MVSFALNFLSIFFLSFSSFASEQTRSLSSFSAELREGLKRSDKDIIDSYLEVHRQFSQAVCRPGTEQQFEALDRNFRGFGFHVPTDLEDNLDIETINRFLPEIRAKKSWIDSKIKKVQSKEQAGFDQAIVIVNKIELLVRGLLEAKRDFHLSSSSSEREKARVKSRFAMVELREAWRELVESISYLTSYGFPVDHFDLRSTNDHYRSLEGPEARKRSNEVYFFRQILQDGAQNPDRSRSDAFLRSVLDSITIWLEAPEDFLTENLRYDLNFALSGIRRQLGSGRNHFVQRLTEWKKRTGDAIKFYESLQSETTSKEDADELEPSKEGERVASTLAKARHELRDFSLTKQAEAYHFWRQQPELFRALYAIETILYNEVADLDGREALERKDITQVVINRWDTPRYSRLEESDSIFPYLNKSLEDLAGYRWLNALFKEGEFSFTYFFIRSNIRIYCPETTRRGRFLLRENLGIGLEVLRAPKPEFDALRYFSRHSMQGRIDMSDIWSEYEEIPERLGPKIGNDRLLKNAFEAQNYTYYYPFKSENDRKFDVLEINGSQYVRERASGLFYGYRNPHFFRYYRERVAP